MTPEQTETLGAELRALAARISSLCPTYNEASDRHCTLASEAAGYEQFYTRMRSQTYWAPAGTPAHDLRRRVDSRYAQLCDARDAARATAASTYSEISACWRRAEDIAAEILGEEPRYRYLDSLRGLECISGGRQRCISSEEIETGHLLKIANYLAR